MKETKKANHRVQNGGQAMDRISEAGDLLAPLIGADADQDAITACMDLECEAIELHHELIEQKGAQTVRNWLEPKRDVLLEELKKRGLDKSENAQFAFKKIEAVLKWVDGWKRL